MTDFSGRDRLRNDIFSQVLEKVEELVNCGNEAGKTGKKDEQASLVDLSQDDHDVIVDCGEAKNQKQAQRNWL